MTQTRSGRRAAAQYGAAIGAQQPTAIKWWRRPLAWRAPVDVELGMIGRASLAAGVAWWLTDLLSDGPTPLLAVFTALVVIQVSARASLRMAATRTAGVLIGACLGLALGETVPLSGVTVALIVGLSLLVADFALRLPLAAARQVPMAMVLVVAAASAGEPISIWQRVAETALGAAVGAAVTLLLPVSRVVDRRRALVERARRLGDVYTLVGAGLATDWTSDQSAMWRQQAGATTDDVAAAAAELDVARNATSWSYRRRRDDAALDALQTWARWLGAATAGLTTLLGDLDRLASRDGSPRPAMPAVAATLAAVATAVAATADHAAAPAIDDASDRALGRTVPATQVDAASIEADAARLAVRLRPSPRDAIRSRAASPSPR